jgi:hypothetical protein
MDASPEKKTRTDDTTTTIVTHEGLKRLLMGTAYRGINKLILRFLDICDMPVRLLLQLPADVQQAWKDVSPVIRCTSTPCVYHVHIAGQSFAEITHWVGDRRHRLDVADAPTVECTMPNNVGSKCNHQLWHIRDVLRRTGGPARIEHNGYTAWYSEGKLHRQGGPAAVRNMDGGFYQEEYWVHGQLHRVDGPALNRIIDGREALQKWYMHDVLHRADDQPAVITAWNSTTRMEWWMNGQRHRAGAPACVWKQQDGKETHHEWWDHGIQRSTPLGSVSDVFFICGSLF